MCTFPLVLHLADAFLPTPDPLHESWILAWDIHALTTNPLHLYDANIYFPFPQSLTYSDSMVSGALTIAPVLLLTGNAVLAHNVLTLASFLIAGLGMYFLVQELTESSSGALIGGSIFAFCAARQGHLDHVNLLQFGWLPLALLYLHRAVKRGQKSDFLLFAFFTACQAIASVYLAFMMAAAYAIFIAVELASRRTAWKISSMARVAGALLLAAIVVAPILLPYARTQQLYNFQWPMSVIGELSAVPTDYLSVPPQNLLYAALLSQFSNDPFSNEHTLFPGIATLILAAIALTRRRMNVEVVRYTLIGLVAFVLSFGTFLRLDGQHDTIALPYLYLLQFVPGFGAMRAPARFDFLVMLALGVLAGFGLATLSTALSRWTGALRQRSIVMAVVVVTMLELVPHPLPIAPVKVGAAIPPVYGWLRTLDPRAVVAEIPSAGRTGYASLEYEYLSTYHWHPLVNGGSAFDPGAYKQIGTKLDAFPDPRAVEDLRSLGVRYLIAHFDDLDGNEIRRLNEADLEQLRLRIAATFGSDVVYEFAPVSNPPSLQSLVRFELPSLAGRGEIPSVTATLTNSTPQPLVVGVPGALGAQIEWNSDGATTFVVQDAPVFVEPNDVVRLHFPAQLSPSLLASESARLTVRLTGSVQLESSENVQIEDLPTSLQRTGLSGTLEHIQLPTVVRPGTLMPVEVTARNTGRAVWLADPPVTTGARGVVGVSVRTWIGADGMVWPPSANSTAHVQWNVNPGQGVVLTLQTSTPPVPGRYSLTLDMLSENVTWFDEVNGGAQTVMPVDVEP